MFVSTVDYATLKKVNCQVLPYLLAYCSTPMVDQSQKVKCGMGLSKELTPEIVNWWKLLRN